MDRVTLVRLKERTDTFEGGDEEREKGDAEQKKREDVEQERIEDDAESTGASRIAKRAKRSPASRLLRSVR
ncbi:hypothetical protein NDU88_001578 [Pleurodeles waltl]|uniref:Uncharacterized protein n=1 Tax=Pleurodeles waltl TaxID=8319 RepID=A0AAV7R7M2_PLEWA|nr:hypothetical protein NDU88_001578 [Pleurodeles waltl]